MKTTTIFAATAVLLALPGAHAADARCGGTASTPWTAAGKGWMIEAMADGPTCDGAVATMAIRNAAGEPMFWTSQVAGQTMVLAYKANAKELSDGLKEWIDPKGSSIQTSDALPEWSKGAEAPGKADAEFPFMQAEGMDRDTYEAIRAQKAPTFCFVQGMESLNCLVLDKDGVLTSAGIQTFPG